jgi:hypothetical protein
MLRDYLQGNEWFSSPAWDAASQVPVGVVRKR